MVSDSPAAWKFVLALLVAIGMAAVVRSVFFKWTGLRRAANRAQSEGQANRLFIFSHVQLSACPDISDGVRGRGWIALSGLGLELVIPRQLRAGMPEVLTFTWSDLEAVHRVDVAGGHAYPRLRVITHVGSVVDVALTDQSGRSIRGVRGVEVDGIARVISDGASR